MNKAQYPLGSTPTLADVEAALPKSIARLVLNSMSGTDEVVVRELKMMFGGNARKAWSFDLSYRLDGIHQTIACVMLTQFGGRQIESEVAHEFNVLEFLNDRDLRIPKAICMDPDGGTIGYPSIILERLEGEANAVKLLRRLPPADQGSILHDLANEVAQLHNVVLDPARFALDQRSHSEIARDQIAHWRKQFQANKQEPSPVLNGIYNWLEDTLPEPDHICLVHGDLRPGNFLYHDGAVTGLLDWEMAHPGDPLEDVGWIYRPLWSPEAIMPLDQFLELYQATRGCKVRAHHMTYWRIFSEVKFATISVTASKAFASGETRNIRHADRQSKVAPCLWRSLEWMERFNSEVNHA